jgi:hypothetical protein
MRSARAGLFVLSALLVPSIANAAAEVRCNWEGQVPVAITVEGDAADFRYFGNSYEIAATRDGAWLLLDEPRLVLSVKVTGPNPPIVMGLGPYFTGGRCWR